MFKRYSLNLLILILILLYKKSYTTQKMLPFNHNKEDLLVGEPYKACFFRIMDGRGIYGVSIDERNTLHSAVTCITLINLV